MTVKGKILSAALLVALVPCIEAPTALGASEFEWRVNGALLEAAKTEAIIFKQEGAKFVFEGEALGAAVNFKCELKSPAAEIEGGAMAGKAGLAKATLEFVKCEVVKPAGFTVTVENIKLTGEITEIKEPAGQVGHNDILFTVTGEPTITLKEKCGTIIGKVSGTIGASAAGNDKVEQEELNFEFPNPPISKVKTFAGAEPKPEMKFFGAKLSISGVMAGKAAVEKTKWGIF
jgi:hypothetical protein